MKQIVFMLVLGSFLAASSAVASISENCLRPMDPLKAYQEEVYDADIVVAGEFQTFRSRLIPKTIFGGGTIDAVFKITKVYKGKVGQYITVRTVDKAKFSGFEEWSAEKKGSRWLLYAHRVTNKNSKEFPFQTLVTARCSGTVKWEEAGERLKFLDTHR